jgi:hypothetical protein
MKIPSRSIVGFWMLFVATTLAASAQSGPCQRLYRGERNGQQVLLDISVSSDGRCSAGFFLPDSACWIALDGLADRSSSLHLKPFGSDGDVKTLSVLDVKFDRRQRRAHALWGMPGRSGVRIELERIVSYTDSDIRWRRSTISAIYPVFENLPNGIDRKLNRLIHGILVQRAREEGVEPGERYEGIALSTELSMSVSRIDSTIVSLSCDIEEETGGPHLNHWTEGFNILLDRGSPRMLSLSDLIRTDTVTLRRIGATCREHESVEGSGGEADSLAEPDLDGSDGDDGRISDLECVKTFLLLREDIEFIWMEAELEPPHFAMIPYRLLAPVIKPDGPLARFRHAR